MAKKGTFEDALAGVDLEMFADLDESDANIQKVSTGMIAFDLVLGGGIPRGLSVLLASDSGIGKTHISLQTCKAYCQQGFKVIYLDYEGGVNESQTKGIGVHQFLYHKTNNPEGLLFLFKPVSIGEGEKLLDALIRTNEIALVVVDSVTAMTPDRYINEDSGKSIVTNEPGIQARSMSVWYQKFSALAMRTRTSFLYLTQTRVDLSGFRATVKAAGGKAQEFYTSIRLFAKKKAMLIKEVKLADGSLIKVPYGSEVELMAVKNRFTRPFIPVELVVYFGKGISNIASYVDWLTKKGFLVQGGAGYYTLTLGEKELKLRGKNDLYSAIKTNIVEIKNFVDERGGFILYN